MKAWAAALALAVLGVAYAMALSPAHGLAWDDGLYVVLGKALATGQGYRVISAPGLPYEAAHPPLYAALLALGWLVAPAYPANLVVLKGLNVAMALAAVAATFALVRWAYGRSPAQAAATAGLVATSSAVLVFLDFTMSELAFLSASTLALAVIERWAARELRPATVVGMAVAAAVPAMIRTLGVTLGAGVALWLAWQRRWKALAGFLAATVALHLPWQAWTWYLVHSHQPLLMDYMGWLGRATGPEKLQALLATAYLNGRAILVEHLPALLAPAYPLLAHGRLGLVAGPLAWLVLVGLAGWGLYRAARPRPLVAHAYALAYLAVVVPFPWPPGRYLAGLAPVLLFGLVEGSWRLGSRVVTAGILGLSAGWGLAAIAAHLAHPAFPVLAVQRPGVAPAGLPADVLQRFAARVEPDAVFLDRNDFATYLLTGHESYRPYQVSSFAAAVFPELNARVGSRPVYAVAKEMPGWHPVGEPDPSGLRLFKR